MIPAWLVIPARLRRRLAAVASADQISCRTIDYNRVTPLRLPRNRFTANSRHIFLFRYSPADIADAAQQFTKTVIQARECEPSVCRTASHPRRPGPDHRGEAEKGSRGNQTAIRIAFPPRHRHRPGGLTVGGANVRRALAVYHHRLPTSPTGRAAWAWASTVPPASAATVNSRRAGRCWRMNSRVLLCANATVLARVFRTCAQGAWPATPPLPMW
jgi:hypothetical protein